MRLEDHRIARKLLNIREELNRQKATEICNEHAAMLDDFSWQIEEEEELNEKLKGGYLYVVLSYDPSELPNRRS